MSATQSAPDAQQLAGETLRAAPFPGRAGGLRVFFDQAVHDAISRHAGENTTVEICGVLVGAWKQDEGGPYVHVSASIRGDAAASKFAEVTFTHETWSKINERMDKEFADRVIVGWYHTHPDFGVFLSERDVFIHQHFFSAPGQVALVVDPIRHEEGVFIWKAGKPALAPVHWIGAGQRFAPTTESLDSSRQKAPVASDAGREWPPSGAGSSLRTSPALLLVAFVGLFACGYLIAGYNQRQERYLIAEALAQQLYSRTNSFETKRSMQEIRALLAEIGDESRKLTEPVKSGVEPPKPERIGSGIIERATRANLEVERVIASTSVRPEQQAAIDWLVTQRLQAAVEQNIQDLISRGVLTKTKAASEPAPSKPSENVPPDSKPGAGGTGPSSPPLATPSTGGK